MHVLTLAKWIVAGAFAAFVLVIFTGQGSGPVDSTVKGAIVENVQQVAEGKSPASGLARSARGVLAAEVVGALAPVASESLQDAAITARGIADADPSAANEATAVLTEAASQGANALTANADQIAMGVAVLLMAAAGVGLLNRLTR